MRTRAAAAMVTAALVAVSGCGSDDTDPAPREGVRVEDLTGDVSGSFDLDEVEAGQEVALRVTVSEVISPDSFVVPPAETAGAPLLVLAKDHELAAGDVAQVGGPLEVFSYDDHSQSHDLAAEQEYRAFAGKVALVAELNDDDLPLDDR